MFFFALFCWLGIYVTLAVRRIFLLLLYLLYSLFSWYWGGCVVVVVVGVGGVGVTGVVVGICIGSVVNLSVLFTNPREDKKKMKGNNG